MGQDRGQVGVGEPAGRGRLPERPVHRAADLALYRAKAAGRDRVAFASGVVGRADAPTD